MSETSQRALELAIEVDSVTSALELATAYVGGQDQAATALNNMQRPYQSALRTKLEHAQTTAERVADYLRDMAERAANAAPPAGPPLTRDQGPN